MSPKFKHIWRRTPHIDWIANGVTCVLVVLTAIVLFDFLSGLDFNRSDDADGIAVAHDKAVAACKKAIAANLYDPEAYCSLGAAYGDSGRYLAFTAPRKHSVAAYMKAVAAYEKAIALKPDHAKAHRSISIIYRALENYVDAVAAYDKAVAIEEKTGQATAP